MHANCQALTKICWKIFELTEMRPETIACPVILKMGTGYCAAYKIQFHNLKKANQTT
jgi:hypothetical protein